jgi:ketosteroid isomerase-like protein
VFEMMVNDKIESSAFEYWLRAYGQAWEAGDPDAVAALFTADASYHETPFDEPMVGTEELYRYWSEGAEQAQKNVQFSFIILSKAGQTGIARWCASFERIPSGVQVELDGILTADFDPSGQCRVFREWWHRREKKR